MADVQRELWREARRQISEYETRTNELTLDLQAAGKELSTAKDELGGIRRDCAASRAAKDASDRAALDEHDQMQALQRRREDELSESSRLTLQVSSLRDQLEAARSKAAAERTLHEAHLAELQAHLERLASYARGPRDGSQPDGVGASNGPGPSGAAAAGHGGGSDPQPCTASQQAQGCGPSGDVHMTDSQGPPDQGAP